MPANAFAKGAARVLAGVGALCVTGLAVIAVRWGQAGEPVAQANWQLDRLAAQKMNPGWDRWLQIRDGLVDASNLEPDSPAILEALGLVQVQLSVNGGTPLFEEQAIEYFRQAVALRPTSPYAWANLALAKYHIGQTDAELQRGVANAALFGPWEPEVQFVVADLGFAMWDGLPAELQGTVRETAGNGMKRYGDNIVRIAAKRGRLALVCQSGIDAQNHPKCRG